MYNSQFHWFQPGPGVDTAKGLDRIGFVLLVVLKRADSLLVPRAQLAQHQRPAESGAEAGVEAGV